MNNPDLRVSIGEIHMKNPVMTASGTYGYGEAYSDLYDVNFLGAMVVKGITPEPRKGNPPPRIAETPAGILNAIGLQNPGVEKFILDEVPRLMKLQVPVIVNMSANTIEGYQRLARRLDEVEGLSGLEVNISCPNVKQGGQAFGTDPKTAHEVVSKVRKETKRPIIAKLTPNVTNIASIAVSVEDAGADAVSLINTLLGMAIDIKSKRPLLGNVVGGLSGPAVKPVAVRMVWETAQVVNIPVIGMGGITSWQDAVEFMIAGASAVAIGTGNFTNPVAAVDIIDGICAYMKENNMEKTTDLVGKVSIETIE